MARFARTTAVRRGPSKQRYVGWDLAAINTSMTVIAANTKAVLATFTTAALVNVGPGTIVRTRGIFSVSSDQAAASEVQIGAMGVGFVNSVAGTLGITALPGPSTEALWDGWFVHQFFSDRFEFQTAAGFESRTMDRYIIDSKAMRKFDQDQNMVIVVENAGNRGIQVGVSLRFLVKAG